MTVVVADDRGAQNKNHLTWNEYFKFNGVWSLKLGSIIYIEHYVISRRLNNLDIVSVVKYALAFCGFSFITDIFGYIYNLWNRRN